MTINKKLIEVCDEIICEDTFHKIERVAIFTALFLFAANFFLVFLANSLPNPPEVIASVGTNYFSTIFMPFSIILYFEVFLLIFSIPKSMSLSIARQFEIISLIILLRVFKDVSALDSVTSIAADIDVIQQLLLDMGAAIILFALVSIFYLTMRNKEARTEVMFEENNPNFVNVKKLITLALYAILGLLAGFFSITWILEIARGNYISFFEIQEQFFVTLFTVMIFTDIVLVLMSYLYSEDYAVNFRNAAFIISTLFIRFSITAERPYDLPLAIIALIFGVLVNFLFNFYEKVSKDLQVDFST